MKDADKEAKLFGHDDDAKFFGRAAGWLAVGFGVVAAVLLTGIIVAAVRAIARLA
jgi:hypothetical protein